VEISCPGVEMRHRQSAKVIRMDPKQDTMAVAFLEIDPVVLAFLKALNPGKIIPVRI